MIYSGPLHKMYFANEGLENQVKPSYYLEFNGIKAGLNALIGSKISISFNGVINCTSCGKVTKKSFGQGYCYPCFSSVPQTEECVLRPELCRAHEGIARDLEFAKENCLVDQIVYLALSGGLKVGVTRHHQVPTRWVDQGASKAVKLLTAKNRYTAGIIEVALKGLFADKTNWRKMLTGNDDDIPLNSYRKNALEFLQVKGFEFSLAQDMEYTFEYPVLRFPSKVVSKDLEKEPAVSGTLIGIKGQYLLFDGGNVLNVRKHTGYNVVIENC